MKFPTFPQTFPQLYVKRGEKLGQNFPQPFPNFPNFMSKNGLYEKNLIKSRVIPHMRGYVYGGFLSFYRHIWRYLLKNIFWGRVKFLVNRQLGFHWGNWGNWGMGPVLHIPQFPQEIKHI